MTWNPRDSGQMSPDALHRDQGALFRLPEPPTVDRTHVGSSRAYLPSPTPTVAEAMAWGDEERATTEYPLDFQRQLLEEGIVPDRIWDRWRSMMLRGHHE